MSTENPFGLPLGKWVQVDGDMDPGAHGGTIAIWDRVGLEIREIQPTRACVGDGEAANVGFPFWSREAYYEPSDLDPSIKSVASAIASCGLIASCGPKDSTPLAIACACLAYGHHVDDGPSGWACDVVPDRVQWWGSKRPRGWRYLEDEDIEFRAMVREMERNVS